MSLERREFLLSAAAAAQTPGRKVRIAFFGDTHSHGPEKLRICRETGDWDVVEVVKEGDDAARKRVLSDASIEAVAVEGDVAANGPMALLALDAGKHVHVEKPAAMAAGVMRNIVAAAKAKRCQVQAGYMWRYHPGCDAIFAAVKNGWLGEIYLVRGTMNTLVPPETRKPWARFAGGQMFEQGSHIIDQVVRLMGRPLKITSFLRSAGVIDDGLKDNTAAVFEYPRAMAIITAAVLQPNANAHRFLEVMGTNGTAVLRPIEPGVLEMDLAKAAGPYAAGKTKVPLAAFRRYYGDLADLARAIREKSSVKVSIEDELKVNDVLLETCGM